MNKENNSQLSIENLGYKPATPIQEGINKFVDWYLDFFQIEK